MTVMMMMMMVMMPKAIDLHKSKKSSLKHSHKTGIQI